MKATTQKLVTVFFTSLLFISPSYTTHDISFTDNEMILTLPSLSSQFEIPVNEIIRNQKDKSLLYFQNSPAREIYVALLLNFHLQKPDNYTFSIDYYSLEYDVNNFKMNIISSDEIICYLSKSETLLEKDIFHCSLQIIGKKAKAEKVNFPRPRMGVSNNSIPMIDHLCFTEVIGDTSFCSL